MHKRFTDHARRVVVMAQDEAIQEPGAAAVDVLVRLGGS